MQLPNLVKDVGSFPVTQGYGIKKKEVPVTDNYWVLQSDYWVPLWILGRERDNFSIEDKIIIGLIYLVGNYR